MMVALSRVAQAAPISTKADAQCAKEAIQTLGSSFDPSTYSFHGGTEANDTFTDDDATAGPDVFCDFGGDDVIRRLDAGDVFLGGEGDDFVFEVNEGTFNGGEGNDTVITGNPPQTDRRRVPFRSGTSTREGRGVAAPALLLTLIHRSAWKVNSAKFGCRFLHRCVPRGPEDGS